MYYSKSNHLEFENGKFPKRGRIQRMPGHFRDECVLAAQEIANSDPSPLLLFLSGGADSEVVAESFRLAKVGFRCGIVRYENDANVQDISWAVRYCENRNLEYEIFDIRLIDLFRSKETFKLARRIRTAYLSHIGLCQVIQQVVKKTGERPVIGSGEPELQIGEKSRSIVQIESEYAVGRFMKQNQIIGVPCFFEWSPELYLSFILSYEMQQLLYWGAQFYRNSVPVKFDLYERSFAIERRLKLGGFERFQSIHPEVRVKMQKNYPAAYKVFDFEEFIARLT